MKNNRIISTKTSRKSVLIKQNRWVAFSLMLLLVSGLWAKDVNPTKNVIVMIPDGTSLSVLSASRWLKTYRGEGTTLNVDEHLCGTVTTFSSNAPIGDSAPTNSCYMTGIPQRAGNISMYTVPDPKNDLVILNADSAYQPLATILEAMQIIQQKSAGLVFSCEFPHATPAGCSAHAYSRSNYDIIAPQMAYNNLEVVFGGGNSILTDDIKQHLKNTGTTLLQNDKQSLIDFQGDKIWALFGDRDMPYDLDRDTTKTPSLAQMTSKAIEVLDKNKKGFFLMVEGSKVDWAAHGNDPIGMMSEYLAFDKAVGVAMDYARREGNTTVVVLPDHGNSGFSIGRNGMKKSYSAMTIEDLFGSVSQYKRTSTGLSEILKKTKLRDIEKVFKEYTGIDLTAAELKSLSGPTDSGSGDYMEASHSRSLANYILNIMNAHTTFGFTSGGHTGEEVFLAAYHPKGHTPKGNMRNTELHKYLLQAAGLTKPMSELTNQIFSKHTDVFKGLFYEITTEEGQAPVLIVKCINKELRVKAYSSVASFNNKDFDLGSVAVYVDQNKTFYLPKALIEKMK